MTITAYNINLIKFAHTALLLLLLLKHACSETIVAIVKKNPDCLKDLVNSRQPVNTGKKNNSFYMQKRKGHKKSSKEVPISFSQKPKQATKPSNKFFLTGK